MENTQTGDVKMPITYEDLKQSLVDSGRPYDFDMIDRAYALAEKAHGGQRRRSGEPYICHPLSVASILVELGMDSESIAAALMHDVAEDTPVTVAEIKQKFGPDVALLVDGVTKLTQIKFSNVEDRQAENLRKMLLAMSQDVRVMIIKLCDRLHNMRTGDAWPEQKRRDKARETGGVRPHRQPPWHPERQGRAGGPQPALSGPRGLCRDQPDAQRARR